MAVIDAASFNRLKILVRDLAGIDLKPGKEALVSGRLQKRMRDLGIDSFADYLDRVERDGAEDEIILMLDAISTNVTSFFRETEHFTLLRSQATAWLAEGRTKLRIWCAAASSGEEPYTLAMTLLDVIGNRPVDLKILATDISTRVLEMGRHGTYSATAVGTVPETLRRRYFTPSADGKLYRVSDEMRQVITFNRLNLAKPPYPMKGPFDAVFCRNVMIYFDVPTKQTILRNIRATLHPQGSLMLGSAETTINLDSSWQSVGLGRATVYQPIGSA